MCVKTLDLCVLYIMKHIRSKVAPALGWICQAVGLVLIVGPGLGRNASSLTYLLVGTGLLFLGVVATYPQWRRAEFTRSG